MTTQATKPPVVAAPTASMHPPFANPVGAINR